jgi:hypothetical protein
LQIDLYCAHPHTSSLNIFATGYAAGESFLHKRELILLAEVAYITRLAEEAKTNIRVTFSFFARTRMILEKGDAFRLVLVPQGAQGKHFGRRDVLTAKQCAQQFFAKLLRL